MNMSVDDLHRSIQTGLSMRMARKLEIPTPDFDKMTTEQIEKYKKSLENI